MTAYDPAPGFAPVPAPDRDRRAFIAPLVSTLLTLPIAFLSFVYSLLSPMVCDSCDTEEGHAFAASFDIAWPVFGVGLLVGLVLLVWSWVLPWRTANAARRVGIAIAAPALLLLNVVVFRSLLDLP